MRGVQMWAIALHARNPETGYVSPATLWLRDPHDGRMYLYWRKRDACLQLPQMRATCPPHQALSLRPFWAEEIKKA